MGFDMQLREIFELYFNGELSYDELKDCIRERNDESDATQILDIMDRVETYFKMSQRAA